MVIIGAGVTGALIADAMTAHGLSVIAIDRRHPAHGSTAASTALLQYEIDTHLVDLIGEVGNERAVAAYRANLEGVRTIGRLASEMTDDVQFRVRPSMYVASRSRDVKPLKMEAAARRRVNLPCEVLDEAAIGQIVDFDAPLALWSQVGGEVDPWRLTQALLARCAKRDFELYSRTDAIGIVRSKPLLEVHTDRGRIRAKHAIVAAGYEAEHFLPTPVAKLHSTFALVTEPVAAFHGWKHRCLIWYSARPYLYMRTTSDNRVIVGGEDIPFRNPTHRDARLAGKAKTLIDKARHLFPRIEMEIAYAWAGTFGETKDGLAYIGAHPKGDPRVHFALGYGGNGITFGAIAADVLTAAVLKKQHQFSDTFAFDR